MGQRYSGAGRARSYGRDRGLPRRAPSRRRSAWSASWPRSTPSRTSSGRSCARTTSRVRRLARVRALLRARRPRRRGLVAPCDQDDVWHPSKLADAVRPRSSGGATLAFCDLRIVDAARDACSRRPTGPTAWRPGTTSAPSCRPTSSPARPASCAARSSTWRCPSRPSSTAPSTTTGWPCARSPSGDLAYVDRPLVDYVQHGANVVGWSRAPPARRGLQRRAAGACAPRATASAISSARGCGRARCSSAPRQMQPRKRRALERAARAGLPWLAAGALREQLRPRRTLEARRRALRGALWGRGRAARDR